MAKKDSITLFNVIGIIEGRSKPEEAIIFSAHYDHIGVQTDAADSIYNGANDNASGTTALLTLAHYFSQRNDNERTLIFCAFAGEELGLYGSQAFARIVNAPSIIAMINIEMIGVRNVVARKLFFMTGAVYSDLHRIIRKNLKGYPYKLASEPSNDKMLFERSDNFPFALLGVPAHTLMCSDDNDPCYHEACDEVERLDLENMTGIIKAIALSVRSLVDGSDRPKRIAY